MRLTPDILAAAYEFLRSTPPFRKWKLPEADAVEFHISRQVHIAGAHTAYVRTKEHIVKISERNVGLIPTLLYVMAHEMLHVKQREDGTETPNVEHNAEFKRLGRTICREHGWDPCHFC